MIPPHSSFVLAFVPTTKRRYSLQNNPRVVTTIWDNVGLYWFICHNDTLIGVNTDLLL